MHLYLYYECREGEMQASRALWLVVGGILVVGPLGVGEVLQGGDRDRKT